MTLVVTNSTLGQRCVPFTAGITAGTIEDDQTFTIDLQDPQMPTEVQFPNGASATVEVFERESKY